MRETQSALVPPASRQQGFDLPPFWVIGISDFTNAVNGFEAGTIMGSTIMKQRFCKNLAICSGFALLFLSPVSSAQQIQKDPIVVHATNHATTPRAFRDMTPVPWHNASKVMRRPGRAPHPHIGLVPDR
jgi:hypothetical protein